MSIDFERIQNQKNISELSNPSGYGYFCNLDLSKKKKKLAENSKTFLKA